MDKAQTDNPVPSSKDVCELLQQLLKKSQTSPAIATRIFARRVIKAAIIHITHLHNVCESRYTAGEVARWVAFYEGNHRTLTLREWVDRERNTETETGQGGCVRNPEHEPRTERRGKERCE